MAGPPPPNGPQPVRLSSPDLSSNALALTSGAPAAPSRARSAVSVAQNASSASPWGADVYPVIATGKARRAPRIYGTPGWVVREIAFYVKRCSVTRCCAYLSQSARERAGRPSARSG
jgi:hypothetical protein